jgi:hypothetical protein
VTALVLLASHRKAEERKCILLDELQANTAGVPAVFQKPYRLSTALALPTTSFLSLRLNLNPKGCGSSQGARGKGHCGCLLIQISQVCILHTL